MNKKSAGAIAFLILALLFLWYRLFYSRGSKKEPVKREIAVSSTAPISSVKISKENINEGLFLYPVNLILPEKPPRAEYLETLSYDPFKVPVQYMLAGEEAQKVVELQLSAIITVGEKKIAIINGKKHKEGDMLGPVMIKKIEGNRVYIQTPMGEDYLQLYSERSYIKINFSSPGAKEGGKK